MTNFEWQEDCLTITNTTNNAQRALKKNWLLNNLLVRRDNLEKKYKASHNQISH